MANRRIAVSDLIVGRPLQWDVYGSDGDLLLRRGYVVHDLNQIKVLIDRGLFVDSDRPDSSMRDGASIPKAMENPSVVRMINTVRADLKNLAYHLSSETEVGNKLLALARKTMSATFLDTNVAIGCILLNQEMSYPARHCVDTAVVSLLIARALNQSEEEMLTLCAAALSMNLSMFRQQEKLQNKAGPLNEEERQLIANHPRESMDLLRRAGIEDGVWLATVLFHHEAEDGSGYPGHKKAGEVPVTAKIIAIADRYCASVSPRSYRKTLLPNAAMKDLLIASKTVADPKLVSHLIHALGIYPIGTFVKLADGEIAVVTAQGASATTPCVHALIGTRGAALSVAIKRDTQNPIHAIREILAREQVQSKFTMRHLWGEIAAL
ncbi:MAG: HD domain-containing protein [Undibacterium sp.]|nr:HD domain-containing protein [Undibacterium sp.]